MTTNCSRTSRPLTPPLGSCVMTNDIITQSHDTTCDITLSHVTHMYSTLTYLASNLLHFELVFF